MQPCFSNLKQSTTFLPYPILANDTWMYYNQHRLHDHCFHCKHLTKWRCIGLLKNTSPHHTPPVFFIIVTDRHHTLSFSTTLAWSGGENLAKWGHAPCTWRARTQRWCLRSTCGRHWWILPDGLGLCPSWHHGPGWQCSAASQISPPSLSHPCESHPETRQKNMWIHKTWTCVSVWVQKEGNVGIRANIFKGKASVLVPSVSILQHHN